MSRLLRYTQKLFGSTANPTEIGKFGSLAAGSPAYATNPDQIQELANFEGGWKAAVLGNNSAAIEDRNALDILFARQLAYLFQMGVPEWDSSTEYFLGSVVAVGLDKFVSTADNNTGNDPLTDIVNWQNEGFKTGMSMDYSGATAPYGWILASGKTIGKLGSGATERENADTFRLFNMYWSDYTDALLPIQDSSGGASTRGATALDDWEANKRMSVPDARGRVVAGKDDMGGSAASRLTSGGSGVDGATLGASGGAQTHTLITAEIPAHLHASGTLATGTTGSTHTHNVNSSIIGSSSHSHSDNNRVSGGVSGGNVLADNAANTTGSTHTHNITGSVANTGGGGAHQNTQPTLIMNIIIKL